MCHIFFIIFHQNVDSEQNVHRTYHAAMLKCPKTKKNNEKRHWLNQQKQTLTDSISCNIYVYFVKRTA